jgi:hypothetical protein
MDGMMQFGIDFVGAPTADVARRAHLMLNDHIAKLGLVQIKVRTSFDGVNTRYDVFCESPLG